VTDGFELHAQLAADGHVVGDTDLCRVLLMNDARFPWVVLVPRRPGARELHDLDPMDQIQLMGEVSHIAAAMQADWEADKTNVAALGNQVPQLHLHIVMRFKNDAAWPAPIWGKGTPEPYAPEALDETLMRVMACLP
jgi:diadenosine tetraphosphate (Ap4A) HIT family hydrolase